MKPRRLHPAFLDLAGRKVVVVGGGPVATQKVGALLEAGALVTVVAPRLTPALADHARAARLQAVRQPFRPGDLDGAWWVVAAAPPEVNRAVGAAAEQRGIFVNAVDDPAAATAYLGGVVRRGGITVAISSEGVAPALVGLLREALGELLPEDLALWVERARSLRTDWRRRDVPLSGRRPLLLAALNDLYQGKRHDTGAVTQPLPREASP